MQLHAEEVTACLYLAHWDAHKPTRACGLVHSGITHGNPKSSQHR